MKYLSIALICMLFVACTETEISVGQKTTVEVDPKFDAGTVIQGEIIKAKFNITNTGDYPLVISDVTGSCSCTVASFPDDPVLPGETGEILAEVTTQKASGVINKTVRIVANTEEPIEAVVIHATVKKRK